MNPSLTSAPLQAARTSLTEDLMDGRATLAQGLDARELKHERVAIVIGYWAIGAAGPLRRPFSPELVGRSPAAQIALDVMRANAIDHLDRVFTLSDLGVRRLCAYAARYTDVSGRGTADAASHAAT